MFPCGKFQSEEQHKAEHHMLHKNIAFFSDLLAILVIVWAENFAGTSFGFHFPDFGGVLSEKCLPEAKRCDIIRAWTTLKTLMSWLVMLFQHTFNQHQSEVYFTSCVLRIVLFEQDIGVQHCNMQKVANEFLISNLVCYLRVNAAAASAAGDCTQGN